MIKSRATYIYVADNISTSSEDFLAASTAPGTERSSLTDAAAEA